MSLTQRQLRILLVVGVIIGLTIAPVASALTALVDNTSPVDDVTLHAPDGPAATFEVQTDADLTNFSDPNTLYFKSEAANVTLTSQGRTDVRLTQLVGDWTNMTNINAGSTTLTVNPEDKSPVDISGGVTALNYRTDADTYLDNTHVSFVYSASSTGNVTLHSLPANTQFTAATKSGTNLGTYQTDGSGAATIQVQSATTAEVILFTNHAPQASNLQPANGTQLSSPDAEFSADISDTEFSTAQGDQVTAELFVDGQSVGSKTVSSNQTVSVMHTFTGGGEHTYYWELTDSYGGTTTTATRTLQSPSELSIYNVSSSPLALVDDASVEIRMYQGETVIERSTTDGVIDMSGVSPAEPFVVVASVDGYYDRRIFVQSLYDRQSVYLLPDNATAASTIFELQEFTGQFPPDDTVLQVERPVNGSWEVALGDYFGANGQFPATLERGQRYRLRLLNVQTDESRLLGTYTPLASGTQDVVVSPGGLENISNVNAGWELYPTGTVPATSVTMDAEFDAADADITAWSITYTYVASDGSTTTLYTDSGSDPANADVSPELNLSGRAGGSVQVVASFEGSEVGQQSQPRTYRVREVLQNDNSILASVNALVGLVPGSNQAAFTSFLAMLLTVLLTAGVVAVVPMSTEMVGVVAWLFVVAFGIIGWVSYSMVFVAGVGAGSFIYIRRPI